MITKIDVHKIVVMFALFTCLFFSMVGLAIAEITTPLLFETSSPNPEAHGCFGRSVSVVPDVDGDGLWDMIVGARGEMRATRYFEGGGGIAYHGAGRAYIISGSSGEVLHTLVSPHEVDDSTETNGSLFGQSVSGISDVDGDGFGDVIVGSRENEDGSLHPKGWDTGQAYVFSGFTGELLYSLGPIESVTYSDYFGQHVSGLSDVDGDGLGDFAVGTFRHFYSDVEEERAYVFSGADGDYLYGLELPLQEQVIGMFENIVVGLPDVNGDDRADIGMVPYRDGWNSSVFRTYDTGRAYIFSGADGSLLHILDMPTYEEGCRDYATSLAAIPDVDGDGTSDIAVGTQTTHPSCLPGATYACISSEYAGRVHIFSGSTGEHVLTIDPPYTGEPDFDFPQHGFGKSVAGLPDLDGDGRGEVVVGGTGEHPDADLINGPHVYIYSGATGTLLHKISSPHQYERYRGFGFALSGLPDLARNGHGNLFVGAPGEDNANGHAYVFEIPAVAVQAPDDTVFNLKDRVANIPIEIDNLQNAVSVDIVVGFDGDIFTADTPIPGPAFISASFASEVQADQVVVSIRNDAGLYSTTIEVLFYLPLTPSTGAAVGAKSKIEILSLQVTDAESDALFVETYHGNVTIAAEIEPGDVDFSGVVDILDVIKALRHVVGTEYLSKAAIEAADLYNPGDGNVVVLDAMEILALVTGEPAK